MKKILLLLFPVAIITLLGGLWAGLERIGWVFPIQSGMIAIHGPLMIGGFLGIVIGIERAVAINKIWAYTAPFFCALGSIALIFLPLGNMLAPLLISIGSLGLFAVYVYIIKHQPSIFHIVMAWGTLLWLGGNVLWLMGFPIGQLMPFWAAYLILTILGERLELSRIVPVSRLKNIVLFIFIILYNVGLFLQLFLQTEGQMLTAASLIFMTFWFFQNDLARRTIRKKGITRYIAFALMSGYVWLIISALITLSHPGIIAGPYYDAAAHSLFLGFVFLMIFGHAPIIVPAIFGKQVAFSNLFYTHVFLLHISLLIRVYGDLILSPFLRLLGSGLNFTAIILFIANILYGIYRYSKTKTL